MVWGGPSRLFFHGVAPLADGEHAVMGRQRINLTFRKRGDLPLPFSGGEGKRRSIAGSHGLCSEPGANMTTSEVTSETSTSANSTGVYLAVLQLVFTLGWTTYVIYLPKLSPTSGSRRQW